ncbi:Tetratricopeptide repeat-containing protein [Prosthecobacter debontii]|uniref:Bacterial kinesin light chain 2 n=1 Tax=Prosthecobacter debontii TaxID=48467 RepID=A8Y5V1_9BACT|nr:tetratricopeptide repeat protein [Prosthecobacter debontii]CAP16146.1 bacterial kinesin light chain 2 [Prosthecobacter debontii]SKA99228.1 Tetratricopeptide repeat-containing protein [Prosthecobacter debontii]
MPYSVDTKLDRQIEIASRHVEEARRAVNRDASFIGQLVEQISVLASLRQKDGDFPKAESLYREALYSALEARPRDADLLIGIYSLLAHLYDRWGRMPESAEFYQMALDAAEKAGVCNSKVATIKNNLAMIYKQQHDYAKAEQYYLEALDIFEATDGRYSASVASVFNNLGVLYYLNLDVEHAMQMHEQALVIRQNLGESQMDPADLSQTYINLGAAYKATGDFQQAEVWVERAKKLRAQMHMSHPTPQRAASLLVDKPF